MALTLCFAASQTRNPANPAFHTDVPEHSFDVILGRPEKASMVASVLAYQDLDGYIEYGTARDDYRNRTPRAHFRQGIPFEVAMESLTPDTRYFYRLRYRGPGETAPFWAADEAAFRTQRGPGTAFRFTIQTDARLDARSRTELYARMIENAVQERPDFHVDLGNSFMTGARGRNYKDALPQYIAQRYYFGSLCRSAALFTALGDLDGEAGFRPVEAMALWAQNQRKRYFPTPGGNRAAYYSWEWGDGLFVVLDPYWPTAAAPAARNRDAWQWTLGAEQYKWLAKTLEDSRASLRFVFIHRTPGGKSRMQGEWGGLNTNGTDAFRKRRPDWEMPIHRMLAKNRVNVVFLGDDRAFARDESDGVIYQSVPTPDRATPGGATAGHIVVRVSRDEARVEFVAAVLPADETRGRKNAAVVSAYRVKGRILR